MADLQNAEKPAKKKKNSPKKPAERANHVEKVIVTVCWMPLFLLETGLPTGYAVEQEWRPAFVRKRKDGAGMSTSGMFDRYARGDSSPRAGELDYVAHIAPASIRMLHSELLKVVHKPPTEGHEAWDRLIQLAPYLNCKMFDFGFPDEEYIQIKPIDKRMLSDLTAQGDENALAALLLLMHTLDIDGKNADKKTKVVRMRRSERQQIAIHACQCLVFMLSGPRFRPARTALVARLRQRFLDAAVTHNARLCLERYDFVALSDRVAEMKQKALADGTLEKTGASHRQFLRALLAGKYGKEIQNLLQVPLAYHDGVIDDPAQREPFTPRPIVLEVFRKSKQGRLRPIHYGKAATQTLINGLGDYWVAPRGSKAKMPDSQTS